MRKPRLVLQVLSFVAAGLLAACGTANLDRYYTPEAGQTFPRTEAVAVVDGGQDAEAAYKAGYENRGYVRIGRISFVGREADDASVVDFGRRIGADVVVLSKRFVNARVIDNPQGPAYSMGPVPGSSNTYGSNEPLFDPAMTPSGHEIGGPESYVVRDYRQVAIFLRRI